MSRHADLSRKTIAILTMIAAALAAGCSFFSEERFMDIEVREEQLRRIDPINLDEMRVQEDPTEQEQLAEDAAPKPEVELSLDECRVQALESNLGLRVQLRNPPIAETGVGEARAQFEPSFFANFRFASRDIPISSALDSAKSKIYDADMGVTIPLRTGGQITFDLAANRTETNNVFTVLNPSYNTAALASISQPLLRNAGVRANTHGIRIARYQRQISEANAKLDVIRVLAAVDRVYWRLYASRRELEVRKNEYDLAVAQLERAQRRVNAGAGPQVEVIRAEAGVAERLEAIIIADNNVRDRERDLKRILNRTGLEIESPTVIVPTTEPAPMHYKMDLKKLIAAALVNRMELLILELQRAQDRSQEAFDRNQMLPLLTLDYTYNVNGLGATAGDAFDLLDNVEFDSHSGGARLIVPIGNKAARSRLHRSMLIRLQRIATKAQREALIRQEVANAADGLEATWQRILASRQRTILAARTLKAEERQFELGLRTSTDVLEAQTDLADAQSAEVRALTEYQISQVDLAFATGMLLGASGVEWEPIDPLAD